MNPAKQSSATIPLSSPPKSDEGVDVATVDDVPSSIVESTADDETKKRINELLEAVLAWKARTLGLDDALMGWFPANADDFKESVRLFNEYVWQDEERFLALIKLLEELNNPQMRRVARQYLSKAYAPIVDFEGAKSIFSRQTMDHLVEKMLSTPDHALKMILVEGITQHLNWEKLASIDQRIEDPEDPRLPISRDAADKIITCNAKSEIQNQESRICLLACPEQDVRNAIFA